MSTKMEFDVKFDRSKVFPGFNPTHEMFDKAKQLLVEYFHFQTRAEDRRRKHMEITFEARRSERRGL